MADSEATKLVALSVSPPKNGADHKRTDLINQNRNDPDDISSDIVSIFDRCATSSKPKMTATPHSSAPPSREQSPDATRRTEDIGNFIFGAGGAVNQCLPDQSSQLHVDDEMNDVPSAVGDRRSSSTQKDVGSPGYDLVTIYESPSSSGDSQDVPNIALEQTAKEVLRHWYGVDLDQLVRPIRVILAFESLKEHCTAILQDEGHFVSDEYSDHGSDHGDAGDAGGPYGSCNGGQSWLWQDGSGGQSSGAKKRSRRDDNESDDGANIPISHPNSQRPRRPNERRCNVEDFSCPYRKRNPLRFSAHSHPDCANKSYKDISTLKKHLRGVHHKRDRVCNRCGEAFENVQLGQFVRHLRICSSNPTDPPANQDTDPEDGFDDDIESRLVSRSGHGVNDWATLYTLLFGATEQIPWPGFEPVVENHEVAFDLMSQKDDIKSGLRDITQAALADNSASNRSEKVLDDVWQHLGRNLALLLRGSRYFTLDSPQSPDLPQAGGLNEAPESLDFSDFLDGNFPNFADFQVNDGTESYALAMDQQGPEESSIVTELDESQHYLGFQPNSNHQNSQKYPFEADRVLIPTLLAKSLVSGPNGGNAKSLPLRPPYGRPLEQDAKITTDYIYNPALIPQKHNVPVLNTAPSHPPTYSGVDGSVHNNLSDLCHGVNEVGASAPDQDLGRDVNHGMRNAAMPTSQRPWFRHGTEPKNS